MKIDADKLKAEIEKRAKFHNDAMKACTGLNNVAITHSAGWKEDTEIITIIDSLQQEQPDMDLEKETIIDYVHNHYHYDKDFDGYGHSNRRPVFTREDLIELARHFYELGQREMRNRISNPEYNKQVVDKMKSEYPIAANEEELKKAIKERYPMPEDADAHTRDRIAAARNGFLSGYSYELGRNAKKQ